MPQMIVGRPLEKFELTHERWLQPAALRHLRFREALAPSPALRFRKIGERALGDSQTLQFFEELYACRRREAVARARNIYEPAALVVPKDECVERVRTWRVAADDEFLPLVHPHLHPGAGSQPGLVDTAPSLGDQTLESLLLHRFDEDGQIGVEKRREAHGLREFRQHLR